MSRAEALLALLTFPFVLAVAALIVGAIWLAAQEERHSDYLAPWSDRTPGDLPMGGERRG